MVELSGFITFVFVPGSHRGFLLKLNWTHVLPSCGRDVGGRVRSEGECVRSSPFSQDEDLQRPEHSGCCVTAAVGVRGPSGRDHGIEIKSV